MELVNSTPLAAKILITEGPDTSRRAVLVIAKATFNFDDAGRLSLERDDPLPILDADQETPLGILPKEDIPRLDQAVEFHVLGCAHAPRAQPTGHMRVSLTVDGERRELDIWGDRFWVGTGNQAEISPPRSFTRMPLTWDRAYGGSCEVEIDEESFVDINEPLNILGKGFDHISRVKPLAEAFRCPEGFPRYDPTRALPNIEDPRNPIRHWDDQPVPVCWSPAPLDSGILVERARRHGTLESPQPVPPDAPFVFQRAHPDLVFNGVQKAAIVRVDGITPEGRLQFQLPEIGVTAEVITEDQLIRTKPTLSTVLLLMEENRLALTFRAIVPYHYQADEARGVRLSLSTMV